MPVIQEHISLQAYNTFGIDVKARFFCELRSMADLQAILTDPRWRELPKLILGGGSNVLFTKDFPGLALKMKMTGIEKIAEDEDHVWIRAGAGETWHPFVLYCLANQYAGVENLSLIPGTVGAAPMQNIGAYGVELTQVFDCLTAVRIQDGEPVVFHHADCHFGYRDSVFKNRVKNQYIITDATYRLSKKPSFHVEYGALRQVLAEAGATELSIKAISDAVIKIRTEKLPDPKVIGNAGSFFKNPVISAEQFKRVQALHPEIPHYTVGDDYKIPAAWLIEQCHWKGYRARNVGVHEHHALVLVNYGGGSGHDIHQLALDIQTSVREKFAIEILPEVNII
jgi:UDP-N-acetylmuramate dehydrogenase